MWSLVPSDAPRVSWAHRLAAEREQSLGERPEWNADATKALMSPWGGGGAESGRDGGMSLGEIPLRSCLAACLGWVEGAIRIIP